jgi:hypothetical protein
MKLAGIVGTGSGKLGSSVFATVSGQQIVRQYQPVVSNPATEGQTAQRAKLKLMSQLGAAMAPVIVMRKDGLVSARNKYIKRNIQNASVLQGTASVNVPSLQITDGVGNVGEVDAIFAANSVNVTISDIDPNAKRVVFILFRRNEDGTLSLFGSAVKPVEGSPSDYTQHTFAAGPQDSVAYVYTISDVDGRATARFEQYNVNDAIQVASLVAGRSINVDEYRFSGTAGAITHANG